MFELFTEEFMIVGFMVRDWKSALLKEFKGVK